MRRFNRFYPRCAYTETKNVLAFLSCVICVLSLLSSGFLSRSSAQDIPDDLPFHFMVFGDTPYRMNQVPRVRQMIQGMNNEQPSFSVHIGDIAHPGEKNSERLTCSDKDYQLVFELFSKIDHPLFYTPGDNEWVDCGRDQDYPYPATERLKKLRSLFYPPSVFSPVPSSFAWVSQSERPDYSLYKENQRWHVGPITFAMLHIVGTHNNLQEAGDNLNEFEARNAANMMWLNETFNEAIAKKREGVVLFFHADPMFEAYPRDRFGFNPFIAELTRHAKRYKGKILLIHGDSHRFRVDYPLRDEKTGHLLPNVTRVIVFGDPDQYLTHVTVQPHHEPLFVIEPFMTPHSTLPPVTVAPRSVPLPKAP